MTTVTTVFFLIKVFLLLSLVDDYRAFVLVSKHVVIIFGLLLLQLEHLLDGSRISCITSVNDAHGKLFCRYSCVGGVHNHTSAVCSHSSELEPRLNPIDLLTHTKERLFLLLPLLFGPLRNHTWSEALSGDVLRYLLLFFRFQLLSSFIC